MEERPKRQSEKKRKHEGNKRKGTAKKDVASQSDSGDDNDRQEKEEVPRAASPVMDGSSSSSDDDGDGGFAKRACRPSKRHRLARDSTGSSSSSPRGRGAARPSEWGGDDFRCFHGYPAARGTTFSKRHGQRCDYYACPLLFDSRMEPQRCPLWTWAQLLPEAAARGKPREGRYH
jgi:hypothetical protein